MRTTATRGSILGLFLSSWLIAPATAQPPANNPWALITSPAKGSALSIGEYSSGCLRGAAKLPLDGPGYEVMHPSRHRYYGHPNLVDFIRKLGKEVHAERLGDLLVGDLSQPRGGPAPGGHSSHQTGLDVDLWFWAPTDARTPLSTELRESFKSRSVLDPKTGSVRADEAKRVAALLRLTASDPRVMRIFVHPIIKRMLCGDAEGDRAWLGKLRPWWGHDDHFHVRLACPDGDDSCVPQTPVGKGDGCAELNWWFSKEAQADREKGRATYQAKVGKAPGMPAACGKLLDLPLTAAKHSAAAAASEQASAQTSHEGATATSKAAP